MSGKNELAVAPSRAKRQAPAIEPAAVHYHSVGDIEVMAKRVSESRLFGLDMAQAFTLMLLAQAKGIHPIQAVERYNVIGGKPAMKADAMLADYLAAGGKVKWHQHDHSCCSATWAAPGMDEPVTITWTMADAEKADLARKENYKKYPRQMLRARVISEGVRMTMPGIVAGIYTPEEVADFTEDRTAIPAFTNETTYGSGKYADPSVVKQYQDWLVKFVEDANLKWYDYWTLRYGGELPEGVGDLINRWIMSNHLCKWAREKGLIEAPADFKAAQTDRLVAILYDRDRSAVVAEAKAYCVKVSREKRVKISLETQTLCVPDSETEDRGDASDEPGADDVPEADVPEGDAEPEWSEGRE